MSKRNAAVSVPLGLGARIRAAREIRGWSQSELGRAVGVSKSAVSQWEKGSVQNLKLGNLFATAHVLDQDVRELVFGAGRGPGVKTGAKSGQKVADRVGERPGAYDLPPQELALIRAYGNLPKRAQVHIRALITILAEQDDADS